MCRRAELFEALDAATKENAARVAEALAEISFEETGGGFGPERPPAWVDRAGGATSELLREVNAAPGPELAPDRELRLGGFVLRVTQSVGMETLLCVSMMGGVDLYCASIPCAALEGRGLAHDSFALCHAAGGLALKRLGAKKDLWIVGGKIAPDGAAFVRVDWRIPLHTTWAAAAAAREAGRPPIE